MKWDKINDPYGVKYFREFSGYGKDPTLPYQVMRFWYENLDTVELVGLKNNKFIVWLHKTFTWLSAGYFQDSTAWCKSAFNGACEVAGFKVGDSALAITGKNEGIAVNKDDARLGDWVILTHPNGRHHIGFFHHYDNFNVFLLGGNQSNRIRISAYPKSEVSFVRRFPS